MAYEQDTDTLCLYCGSTGKRRVGTCRFCGVGVCEKCGDTHWSMGKNFAAHHECLRSHDDSFTMIRFVK